MLTSGNANRGKEMEDDKIALPMEVMKQDWLDVDFCDDCGASIKEGETIHLDIEREHAGIIPAYCTKCVPKENE